jgi:TonB family protein
MAVYILSLVLVLIVLPGVAGAQSQNIRPQIQVTGESNGTVQAPMKIPSADQIAQLESQVQSNPEDAPARMALVTAYTRTRQNDKAMEQILWIVGHHPEWNVPPINPSIVIKEGGNGFTAADYQQLRAAWEGALADHPNNPEVLYNGAMFLQGSEGERALQLFRQARQLQPSNVKYLYGVASMYQLAVINNTPHGRVVSPAIAIGPTSPLSPELAARLNAELPTLNDAALLSRVGSFLALTNSREPDNPNRQLGLHLLERATVLEPDNPQWKAALAAAMNPPASPLGQSGAVRIGANVAEANLIRKVEPIYPALAQSARVSGTVEFTAVIGTDGHIQNLQLVRGHPLLVNAAKEAVLQYLYKPTLLNGNPVPIVTTITIPFELSPQ